MAPLHQDETPDHLHCWVVKVHVLPVLWCQSVSISLEDLALRSVGGVELPVVGTEGVATVITAVVLSQLEETLQTEEAGSGVLRSPDHGLVTEDQLPGPDVSAGHQVTPALPTGLHPPGL